MRLLLCILSCCLLQHVVGQNMNGIWRGKLTQEPGGCYPEYFIELQIKHADQLITGFTYDYYDTVNYIKLNFNGRVNVQPSRMVIAESKVLTFKIPRECTPCIKTYDLTLRKIDNEDVLEGRWNGVKMDTSVKCPPGNIYLKRVNQSAFASDEKQFDPATVQQALMKVDKRRIEIVKTLAIDTSDITLELYDNGQIDGDTISIYLNRQLILYKGGLAAKPIQLHVPVKPATDYEMIMYAENLGSIPPNTALMVVTVGVKKYEIYLSSSEVKSSAVRFRFDKK